MVSSGTSQQGNAPQSMLSEQNTTVLGILLSVIAYVTFSGGDAVIKTLGNRYHASQILFFAYVFSCVPITMYLATSKATLSLLPKNVRWVSIRCIAAAVGGPSVVYAFTHLPMTEVYVIIFATPALITLLAIPFLGEKISWYRGMALLLGFGGVLVVLNPRDISGISLGHVMALVVVFTASISAIAMRKVRKEENPLTMSVYPTMAIIISSMISMPSHYVPMPLLDMALMAVVGITLVLAGFILVRSYSYAEASVIAPIQYSQMVWGMLLSAFVFQEQTPETVYYGLPLIVGSGVLILWRESTLPHSKETATKTRWRFNMVIPLLSDRKPKKPEV